jgi:putative DNA primase/helicase
MKNINKVTSYKNINLNILLSKTGSTDLSIAKAWMDWSDYNFLYNHQTQKWYYWNKKVWVEDMCDEKKSSLIEFSKQLDAEIKNHKIDDQKAYLVKILRIIESSNKWKSVFNAAMALSSIAEFPNPDNLISFSNGTLNLTNSSFTEHKKEDMLNSMMDFDYNPNAKSALWNKFIDEIFINDEILVRYVQKFIGYCLTPETSEQCLFFLWGNGCNGKSVLIEVISSIFGDSQVKIPISALLNKGNNDISQKEIIRLLGKKLAVANETEEDIPFAENVIKDLTGSDTLTGRELFKQSVEFKPTHKLIIYGNHKPRIKGTDDGIWRRLRIIPFLYTIPADKRDKNLISKLKRELPAIFNWVLEGYYIWKKEELDPIPSAVEKATREYKKDNDIIQQFIDQNFDQNTEVSENFKLLQKNLYKSFTDWKEEVGETTTISSKKLTMKLQAKGYSYEKGAGNNLYWTNIALKLKV